MLQLLLSLLLFSPLSQAKDEKLGFTNESSLGYVVTGGNSQSETTNINQKLAYAWTSDIFRLTGNYLQTSGTEPESGQKNLSAENWAVTLRFEKVIIPSTFNILVAHGWYGDRFQGIRVGHFSDIGGKYYIISSDSVRFFSELGYRYTRELLVSEPLPDNRVGVGNAIMPEYHYGRLYTEIEYKYSDTLTLGAWIEYLPSITNFPEDQRLNYSPYLTSILSEILSLKVAYEGRYRSQPAVQGNELTDYTFTTSLLARF